MLSAIPDQLILGILFLTGLLAGTVDAIAGGGGLISLPILLATGMPPALALGTNKLQAGVGTCVATFSYYRHGWISFRSTYEGLICGFIGAVLGAYLGQTIDAALLKKIIPVLLLVILLYTILTPKLGIEERKPRMSQYWFFMIFGFVLGFYDGFLGPGTGAFWVFLITFFLGFNLTKATAYTKIFNLNSNLVATACFMLGGNIDYRIALYMAAGQLIGGRLGAHLAIKKGVQIIRPIFICVVTVTICSLIFNTYFGSENLVGFAIVLLLASMTTGLYFIKKAA